MEDYKVALTLNDRQKVNSYFSTCFSDVNYNLKIILADINRVVAAVGWDANTDLAVAFGLEINSNFVGY